MKPRLRYAVIIICDIKFNNSKISLLALLTLSSPICRTSCTPSNVVRKWYMLPPKLFSARICRSSLHSCMSVAPTVSITLAPSPAGRGKKSNKLSTTSLADIFLYFVFLNVKFTTTKNVY